MSAASLQPLDSAASLQRLRPRIGFYSPMIKLLQLRSWWRGGWPDRLYHLLLKKVNRERGYFVGKMSDGTRYVGDLFDFYPVSMAVESPGQHVAFCKAILERIKRPGCIIDVGANMGAVAAMLARMAPDRKMFAFEPLPETAERAAATLAINRLTGARLYAAAVSESDGSVEFHFTQGTSDVASVHHIPNVADGQWRSVSVPSVRLDSLAGEFGPVAMILYDVEGHEPQAVAGSLELIRKHRPLVVFEYSYHHAPKIGWKAEQVTSMITQAGGEYAFSVLHDDGSVAAFPPPATSDRGFVNVVCEPK